MARSPTTSDVFDAIAGSAPSRDPRRADGRQEAVGTIVAEPVAVPASGVQAPAGAQRGGGGDHCRAQGRHRLYSLEPPRLQPLHEWLAKYEQMWNERLDRMDNYLKELQRRENGSDT